MLDAPALSTRVPSEFLGLARVLRDAVKQTDLVMEKALPVIIAPLTARLRRHPRLRHELIAIAEKLYRANIPPAWRIGALEVNKDRDQFEISEVRATPSWFHCTGWGDLEQKEQGISLCRFRLAQRDRRMRWEWDPLAIVSLHALARRIERGRARDHASVLRDLAVLIGSEAYEKVLTEGGLWLGTLLEVSTARGKVQARAIRTWVEG